MDVPTPRSKKAWTERGRDGKTGGDRGMEAQAQGRKKEIMGRRSHGETRNEEKKDQEDWGKEGGRKERITKERSIIVQLE